MEDEVDPKVCGLRNARGWSQSIFTAKLQILGFEISRSIFSKIEALLNYVDRNDCGAWEVPFYGFALRASIGHS